MSKICKKRVNRNHKKNYLELLKKCPGSLYFTLLAFVPYEHVDFGNVFTVKNCYNVLGKLLAESIFSICYLVKKKKFFEETSSTGFVSLD